jgi:hypothetical protein
MSDIQLLFRPYLGVFTLMKLFDMIASIILLRFLVVVCSNSYFTEAASKLKLAEQTSSLWSPVIADLILYFYMKHACVY